MPLKKVRPGLYERTDTPRTVKITPEFAEEIKRNGNSTALSEVVEEAVREQERSTSSGRT